MFVLKSFLSNGFAPTVIRNGRKILVIEIKLLNLRFITSNAYLSGNEYEISQNFNIKFDQHFLPSMTFEIIQKFDSSLPDISYFFSTYDSDIEICQKLEFFESVQSSKWILSKEILIHNEQKVILLALSCLNFVQECFEFQCLLNKSLKVDNPTLLNPFSYGLCSISGFIFKLYKLLYLNNEEIYSIRNEFGKNSRNVSKL
jgi:hypothetical protein